MITAHGPPSVLAIDEPSKAGEARRVAQAMAVRLGFSETEAAQVALVATELATNLHKHAGDGTLIVQGLDAGRAVGLEILAIDRGPGMSDVGRCLVDGYSTAGSPGNGLGAIRRLSTLFDIHSTPEAGTAALARFWQPPGPTLHPHPGDALEVGAVSVPMAGEEACGDAWAVVEEPDRGQTLVLVVDGLGHGLPAAEAAREAVATFDAQAHLAPAEIIHVMHEAMRKTRGAAVAIARVDRRRGEVTYAGIGNISGVILAPHAERRTSMVSHNGTVGHAIRKVQEFLYPWDPGALLVMHSDGLATHWQVDRLPGLVARHPSLVAGVLYRGSRRVRDDVTVLVAGEREEWGPLPR